MDMTPFFFAAYKLVKYGIYPLTWIIVCLSVACWLACLPATPTRRRWMRASLAAGLVLLLLVAMPVTSYVLMSLLEGWHTATGSTGDRFDAVVVLGGGLREPGTLRPTVELSDESRLRTMCGVELYRQGAAPRLLITGGDARLFGPGTREAWIMRDWAIRLGTPPESVVIEDRARTTYENALETSRLLGPGTRIALVTSAYHIPRASALFAKQGFDVSPFPCGFHARHRITDLWSDLTVFDFLPTGRALARMSDAVEEIAGITVYWLAGKL